MVQTFQLTTSRRGRLVSARNGTGRNEYFNSLPHAEVDTESRKTDRVLLYFNSLPHAEVDAGSERMKQTAHIFQLTTSRRGRLRMRQEI